VIRPPKETAIASGEARLEVCQIIARLMELWGFRKSLGQIWTLLYLSDEPLPAAEIAQHLSISRGSTSMALQELLRWGVVRKSWKRGERKDFFEAEGNVVKLALRVLNERELPAIDEAISSLGAVLGALEEGDAPAEEHFRGRTGDLLRLTKSGRSFLKSLVGPGGAALPFLKEFGSGGRWRR